MQATNQQIMSQRGPWRRILGATLEREAYELFLEDIGAVAIAIFYDDAVENRTEGGRSGIEPSHRLAATHATKITASAS